MGDTIPDSDLWVIPVLNPVLGLWVEFPSGSFFGHSWRQRNCLCGLAKIRKTKAMSSVDSMNSGPDGRFSLGPLCCGNTDPI